MAGLLTPQECLAEITAATAASKISFDPGSATISADALDVVDQIADILKRCTELQLQIAGYTDSQGRDETNLALSQERASAVLDALRGRRVPVAGFEAVGFGEAEPVADNDTAEGREANRRIAFTLIGVPAVAPAPVEGAAAVAAEPAGPVPEAAEELSLPAPSRPEGLGQ